MKTVKYIGCFFDPAELKAQLQKLDRKALARTIPSPHVTFEYAPTSIPWEQFGGEVTVKVTGYGNNGENEALQVEFLALSEGLRDLATGISVPHITLSVSPRGKSVNSRDLEFRPITPFVMTGIFGGMGTDGKVHTERPLAD